MSQRVESKDSLDDFPTPPWATRALLEYIIEQNTPLSQLTALEPACGRGHMAKALSEYFKKVDASDIHDYGYGTLKDFRQHNYKKNSYDWIITNPPFKHAEEFINQALPLARRGVAVLVRTVFIESVGRYERIFKLNPPTKFAQFVERVPMVKGRIDKKASTATGYSWVIWEKTINSPPMLVWVPPCRKKLEFEDDYTSSFINRKLNLNAPAQEELFC